LNQHAGETLQDLIITRLAELGDKSGPMSAREAVAAAESLVSYETLRALARGVHSGRITDRVAEGLARALRVPVSRVYAAAGVPAPQGDWAWPKRFERLSAAQRQVVEDVAGAILEAYEKGVRAGGQRTNRGA